MILCGCTTEVDGIVSRGGCRHGAPPPPPPDENQTEIGEGRSGLRISEYLT